MRYSLGHSDYLSQFWTSASVRNRDAAGRDQRDASIHKCLQGRRLSHAVIALSTRKMISPLSSELPLHIVM
jgi:hypothetical protein